MSTPGAAPGITLVELMVALAVLALLTGVAAVAFTVVHQQPDLDDPLTMIGSARNTAIETGSPVSITVVDQDRRYPATALPDGRVVGARRFGVDPITGRVIP
jgi:prepilin-type N-terminal cleavage/methylation domain-containing protein